MYLEWNYTISVNLTGLKKMKKIILLCAAVVFVVSCGGGKEEKKVTQKKTNSEKVVKKTTRTQKNIGELSPKLRPDGKKWTVAYLEGGPYINYKSTLIATIKGLIQLGWIDKVEIPDFGEGEEADGVWKWLNGKSKYLNFPSKAFYSANWEKTKRVNLQKKLLKRKDIDFILALGTWAGQDVANNDHSISSMVMSTSDPVKANIIKSIDNSGFGHITARVDPLRWQRQIQLFHTIVKFKNLGLAYENTETGKSYAAVADIEGVAKSKGFKISRCYTKSDIDDTELAYQSLLKCYKSLSKKVDAIFISQQGGLQDDKLKSLLKPFFDEKIPTFAQSGPRHVKKGALLGIARSKFDDVGLYHAKVMAQIFNGKKPIDVAQVFEDPPKIAFNFKAAQLIGFDPPVDILSAADEVFESIE